MAERSISKIARIIDAQPILAEGNTIISRLLLDSRQFSSAGGVLFFALRGNNHDGHDYIQELIQKGVRNFVMEELPEAEHDECNFLIVSDALQALQKLATKVRSSSPARIIGITGSNGKTIVKEWLSQILQRQFQVCRSPKSYNSQIGVPLSVWQLEPHHQFGIFEAGISRPGEMEKLEEMLKPEIGIFTNIGSAHNEYFQGLRQKISEKLRLFTSVKKLIYQKDESDLSEQIEDFGESRNIRLLSWSFTKAEADLFITGEKEEAGAFSFHGIYKDRKVSIQIPFTDEASRQNALHCWLLALELEMEEVTINKAFSEIQPVEMRLEMKAGYNGNIIINDAYNSDLESLRIALHYLEHQGRNHNKVLVLSEMLQTGLPYEILKKQIEDTLNRHDLQQVIGIGNRWMSADLQLKCPLDVYAGTADFMANIFKYHFRNSAILLKGARSFHFEDISSFLEEKSHETVLKIYLDRMVRNLNYFRGLLAPQTKVMAMVKAFSYGSGSFEIANLLEFHKVDYLAVAYADEGVDLRKAGISLPILVLNAEINSFSDLVEFDLEPEIYSFDQLRFFKETLAKVGHRGNYPVHIKLETGMHRLGFEEEEIPKLLGELTGDDMLKIASAFSHLAASDDPNEREFTLGQIRKFETVTAQIKQGVDYRFLCHITNSSGISNYPESHFDMVRLGIGLYGVGSNAKDKKHLNVVSELEATVSQIKELKPGDSVGYNRTFIADRPTRVAVVSIGYADGFRRSLGNGVGEVAIRNKRYAVVGRVCMDMIMVNITGSDAKVGDEVEIFGPVITIYELAKKMQTIPYEVFTGISQRVKRVYFME